VIFSARSRGLVADPSPSSTPSRSIILVSGQQRRVDKTRQAAELQTLEIKNRILRLGKGVIEKSFSRCVYWCFVLNGY